MGEFKAFAVEQYLSELEHGVQYNFSESGVHPMSYAELCDLADIDRDALFATLVDYPQVNGNQLLRERIAALYPKAHADNVLVTVGATEANTLVAATLLEDGDNVIRFSPTYEQLAGNAHNLGFEVRTVDMLPSRAWAIDGDGLTAAVDERTRIIHVVNPNNPTGQVLSDEDREAIIAAARGVGAWIVADEVYSGTERNSDEPTPSFWGNYERVIAINSMSKAYGLPGLRLGWLLAPASLISDFWRRHEYASITATMMSMHLAAAALAPTARDAITARARRLIRRGFDTLQEQLAHHPEVFSVVPPQASAMSFVKFNLPVDSDTFASRLLGEEDVLVIPGSRFGVEGHFRFSSALPDEHLRAGLARMNALTGRILGSA
ncbi:aminotransferase class I/II-fold pyridoxal phosphate-dependent enzyme [Congregibacter litoralis]|uniref:Aminotransferase n=1 Tax=Congregibacter litoralis KT71 TaxID=314285 RepID=A4AAZ9_9GAMM|nr:aminotransferase class I/II-fold pyridoxal phosphate-dependent enzyme [Congregibacter litoralis]EAQ96871.1 Aspartate/tyrosine/aromatic aminotransferase [Congregibacter litoralis KT71]